MTSTGEKSLVIHMWCAPRTLSTSTMYSFGHRTDTEVLDEPLYAHWLSRRPKVHRPYRDELFAAQDKDGDKVLQEISQRSNKPIVLCKHITKQFISLDKTPLYSENARHLFLVRDPLAMISSWSKKSDVHKEECSLETLGLPIMCELYSDIRRNTGRIPVVLDTDILKNDPRDTLIQLCHELSIEFQEQQLSWPAGPKSFDGLWAKYWYDKVHSSTGFYSSEPDGAVPYRSFTVDQVALYQEAYPFYELLAKNSIGFDPLCPGSSATAKAQMIEKESRVSTKTLTPGDTSTTASEIIDHGMKMTISGGKKRKLADPRNEYILVWVGDRLLHRDHAKVSVLDSAVQGGDAVWEGLRVYKGGIFKVHEHIQRLLDSAKAMAFAHVPSKEFILQAIFRTLAANGMTDGVHMRMTLTRGAKLTSSMNPAFNVFGSNLIVLPEWKPVGDAATYDNVQGVKLITATNRRNPAQCVDSKIHHCNLINNILPKIQANVSDAADALMLDLEGFVSETNATNVFMIKHGQVFTPFADACLPGITRQTIINLCPEIGLSVQEKRISLAEFHSADEVFTTGTMGELTPVREIDGRQIGPAGERGDFTYPDPVTMKLQTAYRSLTEKQCVPLPFK